MRRIAMLIALMAVLVAVGAGSALALRGGSVIHCTKKPCYGSGTYDHIFERHGDGKADEIIMKGGDDLVSAQTWGNDRDVVRGGPGNDAIYVNDRDSLDKASGGKGGSDKCFVDSRREAGKGCGLVYVR
jgi:hypothetical protein